MRRFRLTLAGLMGLIAIAAIGMAAIRHPTRIWANAAFSVALVMVFASVVVAIASRGRARRAGAGFAACGAGYLVLALAPWFEETVGPQLITTPWIEWAYLQVDPDEGRPLRLWHGGFGTFDPRYGAKWDEPQLTFFVGSEPYGKRFVPAAPYSFFRIAHSLIGVAAGLAGGLLALGLARSPDDPDRPNSSITGQP